MRLSAVAVCGTFAVVGLGACGGGARGDAGSGRTSMRVRPLEVRELRAPRLHDLTASGRYPEVLDDVGWNLAPVKAALRNAVLRDEARVLSYGWGLAHGRGRYRVGVNATWISASTRVVSVLLPELSYVPGQGGVDQEWIALTLRVPSASRVRLRALFDEPAQVAAVLADQALTNRCIAVAQRRGFGGIHVKLSDYSAYALTPSGLAVGFGTGVVAGVGCGRLEFTTPYAKLRAFFSPLGRRLVRAVRVPIYSGRP
jgi:hypothetical protein